MRVQTFYVDLDRYRDRARMLGVVAARVGPIHLFTMAPPVEDFATPHLTIEPLFRGPVTRPRVAARLWRLLRNTRADLIHDTQNFMLPLFARLWSARPRPVLVTSTFTAAYVWRRTLVGAYPYWDARYLRQRVQGYAEEWATAQVADALTVFGEGHRAPVAESYGLDPSRVHSLPNCADDTLFFPAPRDARVHGFGPSARVLLFSGNIFRYKGAYELLRAFAQLRPRHPEARLLMVGAQHPSEEAGLARSVAELGLGDVVAMPGPVPRRAMPALLSSCHAYVLPSYMEGCPRGVIEAMACARPVVATALPGITTLDPERAFISRVPRADSSGLALALDEVLSATDLEVARRGAAARERFLSHHTPAKAGDALADLYEDLVVRR